MLIDILALRKICIKEAGVDIGILKAYAGNLDQEDDSIEDIGLAEVLRANSARRDAKKFLNDLNALYANSPKIIESEIIKEFDKNCVSKDGQMMPLTNKKKYLVELINRAWRSRKISGQTYQDLRGRFVGLKGFSPEFQKKIEQRWRNEYSNPTRDGIFDILQGKEEQPEQIQPQLAAVAARKNQRRNK